MTKTILVSGKQRYSKVDEKEVKQWEASASRLSHLMKLAGLKSSDIIKKAQLKGIVIYDSNMSNYRTAKRKITPDHLEFISEMIYKALKRKESKYNRDILKLYLSGAEPTCETYEEYEIIARSDPRIMVKKYESLLTHAGILISDDYDGFYSITDDKGNTIDQGYDDSEYRIEYDGKSIHLSPEQAEAYYQRIIKYMQDSFSELKEGDQLD